MNSKYFKIAMKEAQKSIKTNDVPVGAIIVKNNKVISKSHNTREKNNQIIGHAEVNSIIKANKKCKSCFLYECDMYVTLEPCEMCKKVINNARIKNVFYLANKLENKKDYDKTKYTLINNEFSSTSREKLSKFFAKLR